MKRLIIFLLVLTSSASIAEDGQINSPKISVALQAEHQADVGQPYEQHILLFGSDNQNGTSLAMTSGAGFGADGAFLIYTHNSFAWVNDRGQRLPERIAAPIDLKKTWIIMSPNGDYCYVSRKGNISFFRQGVATPWISFSSSEILKTLSASAMQTESDAGIPNFAFNGKKLALTVLIDKQWHCATLDLLSKDIKLIGMGEVIGWVKEDELLASVFPEDGTSDIPSDSVVYGSNGEAVNHLGRGLILATSGDAIARLEGNEIIVLDWRSQKKLAKFTVPGRTPVVAGYLSVRG